MGKYQNSIETTAGFTYNANKPLDDRLVLNLLSDLYPPSSDKIYDGMIVSVENIGAYRYNENDEKWIRIYDETTSYTKEETDLNITNATAADNYPTSDSEKLITSGGVYNGIKDTEADLVSLITTKTTNVIYGTSGTDEMVEGAELASGTIYIQYDE